MTLATPRRGRPYQVPEDLTPIHASTIDVNARVGWLLLMSRLHHPDSELALGESFNAALRDVGLQADRSAVSRWESGKVPPRWAVLTAYEQALGLRAGQLTSVVDTLRRAHGGDERAAWTPTLDPMSDGFHERLDQLFDGIIDGPATGPEWTELGHHLAATPAMYVPRPTWDELATKLVDQLARSVGIAYLQRHATVRVMLDHRGVSPWLVRATSDYIDEPWAQVINDPIGILEVSEAEEAAELLLEKFARTSSEPILEACVWALAYKVESGHFGSRQLDRIEAAIAEALRDSRTTLTGVQELLLAMPESYRARLLRASRGMAGHERLVGVATHGESFRPEEARRVSQRVADAVRARLESARLYDEDRMTPRLVREALFSASSDRRHYASIALLGTPFRPHLAAVLVDEVDTGGLDEAVVTRFAQLLRYLATPDEEQALLRWLPGLSPEVARDVALTIGHLPSSRRDLTPLVDRLDGSDSLLNRGLLYGLGMRQASELDKLAADPQRSEFVRGAASWWLRHGGAVAT